MDAFISTLEEIVKEWPNGHSELHQHHYRQKTVSQLDGIFPSNSNSDYHFEIEAWSSDGFTLNAVHNTLADERTGRKNLWSIELTMSMKWLPNGKRINSADDLALFSRDRIQLLLYSPSLLIGRRGFPWFRFDLIVKKQGRWTWDSTSPSSKKNLPRSGVIVFQYESQ